MIRFRCSKCSKLLGIDNSEAGKFTRCVRCKARVRIPLDSEQTAPPKRSGDQAEGEDYEVIEEFEVIEEGEAVETLEPVEQLDEIEEVQEVEEIEEVDELESVEDDDRPRRRGPRRRGDKIRRPRDEEDDKEQPFFTRNRITGIVGLVIGPAFLVFGMLFRFNNESVDLPLRIGIMAVGGLIMLTGLFYVIKG